MMDAPGFKRLVHPGKPWDGTPLSPLLPRASHASFGAVYRGCEFPQQATEQCRREPAILRACFPSNHSALGTPVRKFDDVF